VIEHARPTPALLQLLDLRVGGAELVVVAHDRDVLEHPLPEFLGDLVRVLRALALGQLIEARAPTPLGRIEQR
jgi:hypothetical protein